MDIYKFCVAGINYKKADAELRSSFAVNNDQYSSILKNAPLFGLKEVFVLSTCNRTEIYGLTENADDLISLLCAETPGSAEAFAKSAYIKKGREAIEHLFDVAAGLDSQILGDYEIVGQIKSAAKFSRQHGFLGAYLDRLVNSVLQSSKLIKNNTALSGGTVSVAFAATQYIKKHVKNISDKKILLLGTGKIGSSACKNLVDYLGTKNIMLINRSPEKAIGLATELGLKTASIDNVENEVNAADIIVVATNAAEPVVLASHITSHQPKLIIDLSIPFNVEESVRHLPGVQLVNVDELSKLKDETLKKREAEVPKAKAIIAESMQDFIEWYYMRRHVPMLKDLKLKLKELHSYTFIPDADNPLCESKINIKIQRVVNETACKIKETNTKGCHYIAAINDFICTA
ncbi:glutamyl-tRNA reductase [Parafilimonas terrae]|jgi:glutamyl-tRNA reductase|uniref:Glutamyl-tRNA reductase n=1 Tax=Parafilimonas terrae TaxID=1465490 RepID=A0A1I5USM3_9BACT|nr:glutamyl-tRNA reductase [Parafilimonas terrae]SFP98192.1 glutamyl-tRNA reductase [Parafilimonas terrae]